jgi:hypothetical protein
VLLLSALLLLLLLLLLQRFPSLHTLSCKAWLTITIAI